MFKDSRQYADSVIGNEKSTSAFMDVETPAKKLIFRIAFAQGYKWAESIEYRDFNFPNKAIHEATECI